MGDGVRQLGQFGAGRRLDPAETSCSIGTLNLHAIEEQHVKVNVEVQCIAEALDQDYGTGLGRVVGIARFLDQMLGVTGLATHPQKPMLETAAFQVVLELAVHVIRQFPALLRQMASEPRVVFFDDPIEQGLLGPVTLVTTSVLVPADHPGRHLGHDPHLCDTVFLYSLSLSCEILNSQL